MSIFEGVQKVLVVAATLIGVWAAPALGYPNASVGTWATSLHARDLAGNPVALDSASAVFLYDDVLDVTWLRDATMGGRHRTWYDANQWASDLVVGTFDDWRLPRVTWPSGLPGDTICIDCLFTPNNSTFGMNSPTKSGSLTEYQLGQTVYSEMAHLFYVTLGNVAKFDAANNPNTFWGLTNEGAFENLFAYELLNDPYFGGQVLNAFFYWSEIPLNGIYRDRFAWQFTFFRGVQGLQDKLVNGGYAMALRDGDVFAAAPVPEPGTYAMVLAGLGLLGGIARFRKATQQPGKSGHGPVGLEGLGRAARESSPARIN